MRRKQAILPITATDIDCIQRACEYSAEPQRWKEVADLLKAEPPAGSRGVNADIADVLDELMVVYGDRLARGTLRTLAAWIRASCPHVEIGLSCEAIEKAEKLKFEAR